MRCCRKSDLPGHVLKGAIALIEVDEIVGDARRHHINKPVSIDISSRRTVIDKSIISGRPIGGQRYRQTCGQTDLGEEVDLCLQKLNLIKDHKGNFPAPLFLLGLETPTAFHPGTIPCFIATHQEKFDLTVGEVACRFLEKRRIGYLKTNIFDL